MGRPLAVVLGVTLFAILGQGRNVAAAGLLTNGGFEDGTAGWAWSDGTLDTIASPERGGLAGRLSGNTAPTHEVYQWANVGTGETYTFSGWVLLDDPNVYGVFLRVSWYDDQGQLWTDDSSQLTDDINLFRMLTISRQAPPRATLARVGIVVQPALNVAPFAVLMDDLSFSGPPPSTPGPPTPTPTAAPGTPAPPTPAPTPTPVAGSAVVTPAPAAAPPELDVYPSLLNGGFEEGREDGSPLGWRQFGGEVGRSQSVRVEGAYSAAFSSRTTSTKWVYQTVAVVGGGYYSLAAQALKDDPAAAETFLRLSWYATANGSGSALDTVDSRERLTADSPSFRTLSTGAVQAPVGARSAKVRLMLRPVSAAPATVYFDAVTFRPAPPGDGAPLAEEARSGSVQGGDAAAVAVAAPGGRTDLANVKPSRPKAPDAAGGGGGNEWPFVALAVGVPALALASAAAYDWRRRRLAAGDERHL